MRIIDILRYDSVARMMGNKSLFTLSLLSILTTVQAYMINMEQGAENECFHERVNRGVKLGFSFEVLDGDVSDIDVEIKDPNNMILHKDEKSSNGKFTIEADLEGAYQICFINHFGFGHNSYKTIIFDIDRSDVLKPSGNSQADGSKPDEETTKLMGMVESLLLATITTRHDVKYLAARDRIHRRINEATNSRIVWWSAIEFILLLSVTLGQVWYLRRFFEIRRKA